MAFPGTKTRASNGAPSSERHLLLREPSRQVRFSHFFARLRELGSEAPAPNAGVQFSHGRSDAAWHGRTSLRVGSTSGPAGPPFARSLLGAVAESLINAVSCGKTGRALRLEHGSDRRSNAAMGRTSWATALTSDGGLIPSNERAAVSRRE